MKTTDISQIGIQALKPKRRGNTKTTNKSNSNETVGDTVDLSTTRSSGRSTPIRSHEEALDLAKDIDYDQALKAVRITRETSKQLLEQLED